MVLQHGGCPEMTRSVQIVERMRWMSALAGASVLAIVLAIVLGATGGPLRGVVSGSPQTPAPGAGGSWAPLDPRIAALAAHPPNGLVQAIVQFNAPVTPAKAKADAAGDRG